MFVAVAALMAGSIGARNLANIALVFGKRGVETADQAAAAIGC